MVWSIDYVSFLKLLWIFYGFISQAFFIYDREWVFLNVAWKLLMLFINFSSLVATDL